MATAKANQNPNMNPAAPEGWEVEQTGFPPYWNPGEGKAFKGVVIGLDNKDESFQRFALRATSPLMCQRGPADESEEVLVKPGEYFSVSAYAALPLEKYIGVEVYVAVKGKRKLQDAKTLWEFTVMISPESRKILADREQKRLLAEQTDPNF